MSDTDIDFSDNEIDSDDEVLDAADDDRHKEERDEEEMLHTPIPREKRYNTITGPALSVPALNDNVVTLNPDDHPPDNTGRPSRANVKPKKAKEQRQAAFGDAMKQWGAKLKDDEAMHVASGFKSRVKVEEPIAEKTEKAEPWRIKVAIENGHIKGDKSRLNETLYQFFNDFNDVVDAFGIRAANDQSSIDHGIQKDSNGKLVFIGAMTLDRKQRAVAREDGQEENASENRVRVRTAEHKDGKRYPIDSPGAVQNAGYSPGRGDLLLAERITDTKFRVEEVAVFVGPLLPELLKAVFENVAAGGIGKSLGFTMPQASAVGNALLQRALEAAGDGYDRIKKRERKGWTYVEWLAKQPDDMPIPARKLKQAYDRRAKIKAGIVAEVDQAIAHVGIVRADNDNLPLTFRPTEIGVAA